MDSGGFPAARRGRGFLEGAPELEGSYKAPRVRTGAGVYGMAFGPAGLSSRRHVVLGHGYEELRDQQAAANDEFHWDQEDGW